ncbi:MAG: rRNA pseudouridine synthase, partial [Phycisphaerae bacterium]|nr:rRNA pseudouridine synthase [Phycisphaerae bacterium]
MERLQKVMADAGIASRRQCEGMIYKGLVKVNGVVVKEMPIMVNPGEDEIVVSGKKLVFEKKVYYLLHKPKRVVCTNYDPDDRRKACDLMPGVRERVYPVGRLDADSNGLLIMTNDGELANQLTHPRYGVPKTYIVEINSRINGADIEKLQKGFFIATNGRASMDRIKVLKRDQSRSLLEITLCEGRNRQIKRMLARLGHKVKKLTRIKFGPLTLRGLGIGQYRALTKREVEILYKISNSPTPDEKK